MKNNRGFTLVELIATIVILGVVLSITGFAITTVIDNARKKNYQLLITDIKSAAELYYQECTYMRPSSLEPDNPGEESICDLEKITLGDLVKYGYLNSNDTTETNSSKVIHPDNEENISACQIKVTYENDKIKVTPVNKIETDSCPAEY